MRQIRQIVSSPCIPIAPALPSPPPSSSSCPTIGLWSTTGATCAITSGPVSSLSSSPSPSSSSSSSSLFYFPQDQLQDRDVLLRKGGRPTHGKSHYFLYLQQHAAQYASFKSPIDRRLLARELVDNWLQNGGRFCTAVVVKDQQGSGTSHTKGTIRSSLKNTSSLSNKDNISNSWFRVASTEEALQFTRRVLVRHFTPGLSSSTSSGSSVSTANKRTPTTPTPQQDLVPKCNQAMSTSSLSSSDTSISSSTASIISTSSCPSSENSIRSHSPTASPSIILLPSQPQPQQHVVVPMELQIPNDATTTTTTTTAITSSSESNHNNTAWRNDLEWATCEAADALCVLRSSWPAPTTFV